MRLPDRRHRPARLGLLLALLATLLSALPAPPAMAQGGQGSRIYLPALAGGSPTPPPPGAPVIERFYADQLSVTPGAAATLTWSVRGASSVRIEGRPGPLAASGTLAVRPSATATYTLRATNSRGAASRTLTVAVVPANSPDSGALIAQALEDGSISAEQALAYRVYAAFGDDRLPAALRGAGAPESSDGVLRELAAAIDTLSPELQAALRPFGIPPYHAGSWWDLRENGPRPAGARNLAVEGPNSFGCKGRSVLETPIVGGWSYLDSADGKFRFWWEQRHPGDAVAARQLAPLVSRIASRLSALMRRGLINDGGSQRPLCNGSSDAYDISITSISARQGKPVAGVMVPLEQGDQPTPSYIMLDRAAVGRPDLATILVHEMMHAYQYTFASAPGRRAQLWWSEATATWAEHYYEASTPAEPDNNFEHFFAPYRLNATEKPLDAYDWQTQIQYGSYVFPLAVQLKSGSSDFVRVSFENAERNPDLLSAINSALPGGFAQQWPQAAQLFVNRGPVDDFERGDQLKHRAKPLIDATITLSNTNAQHFPLDARVDYLAAHTFTFTFDPINELPRSVLVTHGLEGNPNARVQAIYRLSDGSWRNEDLTDSGGRAFCRDRLSERLTQLTIVISNHDWQNKQKLEPKLPTQLTATNVGCWRWKGTATATYDDRVDGAGMRQVATTSDVVFERIRLPEDPEGSLRFEQFRVTAGTTRWSHQDSEPFCGTVRDNGTFPVTGTEGQEVTSFFMLQPYAVDPALAFTPAQRGYGMTGVRVFPLIPVPLACGGNVVLVVNKWLDTGANGGQFSHQVSADGKTIKSSYSPPETNMTFTWDLTAERE